MNEEPDNQSPAMPAQSAAETNQPEQSSAQEHASSSAATPIEVSQAPSLGPATNVTPASTPITVTTPTDSVQPVQPSQESMQPQQQVTPVMAQPTSTVPMPTQPASVGMMPGQKAPKSNKKMLSIIGVAIGLLLLAGLAYFLVFAKPLVGDLSQETVEGFSFLRPEDWESETEDDITGYHPAEAYRVVDEEERYELLVLHGLDKSSLGGFDASSLSEEDRAAAKAAILQEYGQGDDILNAFSSEVCSEDAKNTGFKEINVPGSFIAIQIDFSCVIESDGLKDDVKGSLQFSIANNDSRLDLFGVVGVTDQFDDNASKITEMLSSTKYE